jgi:undecaprenyl-diphosphatase
MKNILPLALVQGITEAFPISSSAHIALFFGLQTMTPGMDAVLHLGSFLSLCLYFYKDILKMIMGGVHFLQRKASPENHLFKVIIVTTLPCGVVGLMLHALSLRPNHPCITAFSLCFFGGVLYGMDRLQNQKKAMSLETIPMAHAVALGLGQILSLVPGVSRLGMCMIAGRLERRFFFIERFLIKALSIRLINTHRLYP